MRRSRQQGADRRRVDAGIGDQVRRRPVGIAQHGDPQAMPVAQRGQPPRLIGHNGLGIDGADERQAEIRGDRPVEIAILHLARRQQFLREARSCGRGARGGAAGQRRGNAGPRQDRPPVPQQARPRRLAVAGGDRPGRLGGGEGMPLPCFPRRASETGIHIQEAQRGNDGQAVMGPGERHPSPHENGRQQGRGGRAPATPRIVTFFVSDGIQTQIRQTQNNSEIHIGLFFNGILQPAGAPADNSVVLFRRTGKNPERSAPRVGAGISARRQVDRNSGARERWPPFPRRPRA